MLLGPRSREVSCPGNVCFGSFGLLRSAWPSCPCTWIHGRIQGLSIFLVDLSGTQLRRGPPVPARPSWSSTSNKLASIVYQYFLRATTTTWSKDALQTVKIRLNTCLSLQKHDSSLSSSVNLCIHHACAVSPNMLSSSSGG
jgi:hypothetical protein